MFECPVCKEKSITFYQKLSASRFSTRACSSCGAELFAPFFEKFGAKELNVIQNGWGPGMHRIDMEIRLQYSIELSQFFSGVGGVLWRSLFAGGQRSLVLVLGSVYKSVRRALIMSSHRQVQNGNFSSETNMRTTYINLVTESIAHEP